MNMADETISEKCETLYNKLNTFVASVISRDVTPKISNLNTEVWGSDTQTGNSRIDTLNTNFNNLDSSITTMESDINNVESDVSNLQTSVNSLNTSITNLADTTSWKYYLNDSNYKVRYNDYRVNVDVNITGTSASTTFTQYGVTILPDELRPRYPVSAICNGGNVLLVITDNDNKLYRKSMTSSSQSNINIYAHLEWDRK